MWYEINEFEKKLLIRYYNDLKLKGKKSINRIMYFIIFISFFLFIGSFRNLGFIIRYVMLFFIILFIVFVRLLLRPQFIEKIKSFNKNGGFICKTKALDKECIVTGGRHKKYRYRILVEFEFNGKQKKYWAKIEKHFYNFVNIGDDVFLVTSQKSNLNYIDVFPVNFFEEDYVCGKN